MWGRGMWGGGRLWALVGAVVGVVVGVVVWVVAVVGVC